MRINGLNLTKIAPIIQRIPCALVRKMSTRKKEGETKHRASPPLQKVGGTCPPVHPRIYAHRYIPPCTSDAAFADTVHVYKYHLLTYLLTYTTG